MSVSAEFSLQLINQQTEAFNINREWQPAQTLGNHYNDLQFNVEISSFLNWKTYRPSK